MHWNLALGTIAEFFQDRPDLEPLIKALENFNVVGMYLLTELDHGLDTRNTETRATLQSDGSFDLHTPHAGAAKTMPPNRLNAGMARMAIVYARLIAQGVDHGIKMFIVPPNTADAMHSGVTSRALPKRTGARPLDHAVTTFTHVRLPGAALLGSIDKPAAARTDFLRQMWWLAVGSLALSITNIPCLRACGYVAAAYSRPRMAGAGVMSSGGGAPVPILSFSTSQRPVLDAFALALVSEAFARSAAVTLGDEAQGSVEVRMAVAHTFKATVAYWTQNTLRELMVRVGWQGVFGYNQISEITMTQVGASIAEGEILVLCIRKLIFSSVSRTDKLHYTSCVMSRVWADKPRCMLTPFCIAQV
jgi:acyl-CoA oxidase